METMNGMPPSAGSTMIVLALLLGCTPKEVAQSESGGETGSPLEDVPEEVGDDLPFLEDYCPAFTDTFTCLTASNEESFDANWTCLDPDTGEKRGCRCAWQESIKVSDPGSCEGTPSVQGCVPALFGFTGDLDCPFISEIPGSPKCFEVVVGESPETNPEWVTVGWGSCSALPAPDGAKASTCEIGGDPQFRCAPCTEQLVKELCE